VQTLRGCGLASLKVTMITIPPSYVTFNFSDVPYGSMTSGDLNRCTLILVKFYVESFESSPKYSDMSLGCFKSLYRYICNFFG
jgi:hypothetical protein